MNKRRTRLVAMMPVRNESRRYLHQALEDLSTYVDHIVILDDASTDETPDICRSFSKVIFHRNETTEFLVDESRFRARLWELTLQAEPDWILAIDADEVFEERMKHEVSLLIDQEEYEAIEFRLFDFWNGYTHVRVDGAWNPWPKRVRMLVRHRPGKTYTWPSRRLHCGRIPLELRGPLPVYQSDLRVKHYGWARPEDVRRKYERYRAIEETEHLKSVLYDADQVRVEPWIRSRRLPFT